MRRIFASRIFLTKDLGPRQGLSIMDVAELEAEKRSVDEDEFKSGVVNLGDEQLDPETLKKHRRIT